MIRHLPLIFFFTLFTFVAIGQEDSGEDGPDSNAVEIQTAPAVEIQTEEPAEEAVQIQPSEPETPADAFTPPPPVEQEEFIFKPTIGLGVGTMTYKGDLSKRTATNNPIIDRIGFDLRVTQPLNNYLDFSFYMMLGKIGANERTLERNLNFESRITAGGIALSYNFDHFLPEDRVIEPYITLGFESMEFLSKTDLIDQFGNEYNYWADGSIRNLPETPENESVAIRIQRDYVYESDIRALNVDGFGDYDERTFAMPIGAGVNMHLGGKFNFRLGTTLHYTFSDLLDGITNESVGTRQGNKGKDLILFSSFNLNYNLTGDNEIPDFLPGEFENLELADDDEDAIPNISDECPNTPATVEVDAKGCPLDEDGDGVADYLDQELGTPPGMPIDSLGVTLSDDALELIYLEYTDESGQYARFEESYAVTDPIGASRPKPKFFVMIGDNLQPITKDQANLYLNDPNITSVVNADGSTNFILKQPFATKEEAVEAGEALNEQSPGQASGVVKTGGTTSGKTGVAIIESKFGPIDPNRPKDERSKPRIETDPSGKTIYRIQVGAFTKKLSTDIYSDVEDLFVITTDDGLTRYYSGTFYNYRDAANAKIDLVTQGFQGAHVVPFNNGQKISLKQAGATPAQNVTPTQQKPAIDPELIKFKVQLGAYSGQIPTDILEKYTALGQVSQRNGDDGLTKYLVGEFSTYEEAKAYQQELIDQGFDSAFVRGEANGQLIEASEALELLKN